MYQPRFLRQHECGQRCLLPWVQYLQETSRNLLAFWLRVVITLYMYSIVWQMDNTKLHIDYPILFLVHHIKNKSRNGWGGNIFHRELIMHILSVNSEFLWDINPDIYDSSWDKPHRRKYLREVICIGWVFLGHPLID